MARWRLMQPHYLNVPDTEWEYKETNRQTGKAQRKVYAVPRFLHTEDASDFTHPELNSIIVCHEGKGEPRDLVFSGEPTPDMEPLDEEARVLSDTCSKKWVAPMGSDAFPAGGEGGYARAREGEFLKELASLMAAAKPASMIPAPGVSIDEFEALKKQVEALALRNAELEAGVAEPAAARRV